MLEVRKVRRQNREEVEERQARKLLLRQLLRLTVEVVEVEGMEEMEEGLPVAVMEVMEVMEVKQPLGTEEEVETVVARLAARLPKGRRRLAGRSLWQTPASAVAASRAESATSSRQR